MEKAIKLEIAESPNVKLSLSWQFPKRRSPKTKIQLAYFISIIIQNINYWKYTTFHYLNLVTGLLKLLKDIFKPPCHLTPQETQSYHMSSYTKKQ